MLTRRVFTTFCEDPKKVLSLIFGNLYRKSLRDLLVFLLPHFGNQVCKFFEFFSPEILLKYYIEFNRMFIRLLDRLITVCIISTITCGFYDMLRTGITWSFPTQQQQSNFRWQKKKGRWNDANSLANYLENCFNLSFAAIHSCAFLFPAVDHLFSFSFTVDRYHARNCEFVM